ncbi:regulator of hypoxia-inducible factor 1-like [Chironomus tepperi]|uniref:regulator of hypoxia-inducible factor 1-like n=1 Tax=Chironomus tepperi TaxID=113505 RepID=UPI00391F223C
MLIAVPKILLILSVLNICAANQDLEFVKKLSMINEIVRENEGQCYKDLKQILNFVMLDDFNAIMMFNSWSTFSSNYTYGNSYDFGNYDNCLELKVDDVIATQYCLVQFYYNSSENVKKVEPKQSYLNRGWKRLDERFGGAVCLPESCGSDDVKRILKKLFGVSGLVLAEDYSQDGYCKKASQVTGWTKFEIFNCISTIFFIFLAASSTFLYSSTPKDASTFTKIISTFSIKENFKEFTNLTPEKGSITCLNGIRAISIFLIMFYHFVSLRINFAFRDGQNLSELGDRFLVRSTGSLSIAVDAFFVMSGALVSKSVTRQLDTGRLNIWKLYIQRYFRITPTVAITIMNIIAISNFFYRMVPYTFENNMGTSCEQHWWEALLHIQVYTNPRDICVIHSWYLSADFQLFLIAPFLIIMAYKFPCKKLISLNFLILLSAFIIYRFYLIINQSITVEDITVFRDIFGETEASFYYPTHVRGLPFLIGMLLGYLLKDDQFTIVNQKTTILICRSLLTFTIIFFLIYPIPLEPLSPLISHKFEVFLLIFGHFFWSIGISILIFSCHYGHCGFINQFLSSRVWTPIAKMGLSFYLISAGIQFMIASFRKEPQSIANEFSLILQFLIELPFIVPIVMVSYFVIEVPFIKIGRIITDKIFK